jgi:diacylglycerol kinase (ATP)
MLKPRGEAYEKFVEFGERRKQGTDDATKGPRLLVAVNARASGVGDPRRTGLELVAMLAERGVRAESVVTGGEDDLFEALRRAAATGRRLAVVGGDGSLHAAANAALGRLPELALIPAGSANNIARALRIPTDRPGAVAVAAGLDTRLLDALLVRTPERTLRALEGVSAGFHAEARSGYEAENSADVREAIRAFTRAFRGYSPYRIRTRVDGTELLAAAGAQLFVSNLPYFGPGFEVDPGADPSDGRLEAVLLEAPDKARLLRLLAATYRGRHLSRSGVTRIAARSVEVSEPLPLVADSEPLGTTTATVTIEPARIRIAAPVEGVT